MYMSSNSTNAQLTSLAVLRHTHGLLIRHTHGLLMPTSTASATHQCRR